MFANKAFDATLWYYSLHSLLAFTLSFSLIFRWMVANMPTNLLLILIIVTSFRNFYYFFAFFCRLVYALNKFFSAFLIIASKANQPGRTNTELCKLKWWTLLFFSLHHLHKTTTTTTKIDIGREKNLQNGTFFFAVMLLRSFATLITISCIIRLRPHRYIGRERMECMWRARAGDISLAHSMVNVARMRMFYWDFMQTERSGGINYILQLIKYVR